VQNSFCGQVLCSWATVCKTVRCPRWLPLRPVVSVCEYVGYCGQTVGWIKMTRGIEVGLIPGLIVLDGDPAPPPQKGYDPLMSVVAKWLDGLRCHLVWRYMPRPSRLCVIDENPDPPAPSKKRTQPPISAHVYCGQTAGWIKMSLGTKVGLAQATLC